MNHHPVLLATSLVAGSSQLLRTAHRISRLLGVRLDVVHAIRQTHWLASGATAEWEQGLLAEVEESVRARIARQITRLAIPQRDIGETIVRRGQPYQVILEEARRRGAGLIVLRGSDRGRLRIGSTTDRVLRRSEVPVLVVRGQLRLPLRSALLTTDLAPLGTGALRCGLTWVRALAGRRLPRAEVLHAVGAMHLVYPGPPAGVPQELAAAKDALALLVTQADGADSPVRRRVVRGYPVVEILRRIHDLRPDLVVLGTHGAGGLERFLLGSVAADVVRSAGCSALVVPPEAAQACALREPRADLRLA